MPIDPSKRGLDVCGLSHQILDDNKALNAEGEAVEKQDHLYSSIQNHRFGRLVTIDRLVSSNIAAPRLLYSTSVLNFPSMR